MRRDDLQAGQFEEHRAHLRAVAYRMLGSQTEADDAVQETWLRVDRAGAGPVEHPRAWLTTVVSRICLDMLRARRTRSAEPLDEGLASSGRDPEEEALLADQVGLALLVVLETLTPAERLAFVLHDLFAVPFEDIAPIVGRTPAAARQLASRGRRRVQGTPAVPEAELGRRREVVGAFMAASRDGDFDALMALLDPDVVLRVADAPQPVEVRGALAVAGRARSFAGRARFARIALVEGSPGLVVAPQGRLLVVQAFTIAGGRITGMEIVTEPQRLRTLDLAVLPD